MGNLWIRITDGSFRLETTFRLGLRGQFLLGVYNPDSSVTSIMEMGDYGPGIAIHSTSPKDILIFRQCDNDSAFKIGLKLLDSLVTERLKRRREVTEYDFLAPHTDRQNLFNEIFK